MLEADAPSAFAPLAALVFAAVLLLLGGGSLLWRGALGPQARKLQQRLRALAGGSRAAEEAPFLKEGGADEGPLQEWLEGLPRADVLSRYLAESGLGWSLPRLLLTSVAAALAGWLLCSGVLLADLPPAIAAAAGAAASPLVYVAWRRSRRLARMERQLPEALDLIGRALRAGHSFPSALLMVAEEMNEPIAGEFRAVHDEVNYGVSLHQALTHLSARVPLTDVRFFVVAVLIQRDSGGNLTEVLGNLSRLIRERLKLLGKVRVLSSEGRMSAWILGLMPFAIGALLNLLNPRFMQPLWSDPLGLTIVKTLLVLMAVGALIMRKITRIRV